MVALLLFTLVAAEATADASGNDASEQLAGARVAFDNLEYEKVIELTQRIIAGDAAREQKLEALFMQGYALALTNRITDASAVFRKIVVDYDVNAEPPFPMEPRVGVILDAARAEERDRRAKIAEEARAALRKTITLTVNEPEGLRGGQRAIFDVTLDDPKSAVQSLKLEFKRATDADYASLPFEPRESGGYRAAIPGTYTRNPSGVEIAWMIVATDEKGTLLSVGTREQPRKLPIGAGMDVAEGLTAAERLPKDARLTQAALVLPVVAGSLAAATLGAATFFDDFSKSGPPEFAREPGDPADQPQFFDPRFHGYAWMILIFGPPFAAILATGVTAPNILDGWPAATPSAVVAVSGAVYGVLMALAFVVASDEYDEELGVYNAHAAATRENSDPTDDLQNAPDGPPNPRIDLAGRLRAMGGVEASDDFVPTVGGGLMLGAVVVGAIGILAAGGTAAAFVIIDPQLEE